MYQNAFIVDKYPEWELQGLDQLCFGNSLLQGYRKIGATDVSQGVNSGRAITQRDGYGVYDWMYYTPREKILFGVQDTGQCSKARS
jgi:hypothetical protein